MSTVCLTAGFDRSPNAIAVGELLRREGVEIQAIFVVNPYSVKRLRAYVRQQGAGFVLRAAKRLAGSAPKVRDAVHDLLDEKQIGDRSLKAWAGEHGVAYHVVPSLNAPQTLRGLSELAPDWVVYGGGGILRKRFLEATRGRVLNAHAGPLPEIRGMNACEWSLILGLPPHVTIHLINRGIDTGGIVKLYPLEVNAGDTIDELRARTTATGIVGLVQTVLDPPAEMPPPSRPCSRQCYVLAPALRELLTQRLERGEVPGRAPAVNTS
jgi:hypothetical protein